MNVALGIPRLQEILMAASNDIKTAVMTFPLTPNKSMKDAICFADKLKTITVADIIESLKVSWEPVAGNGPICSIYKLTMKLYKPKHVTRGDWKKTLRDDFVRELEDAIEKHLRLLSKISGIEKFVAHKKRSVFVVVTKKRFEIHFEITDEPHILLAQIALRTAKKVCIQNFVKVGQCKAITCKESGVMYYGDREDIPALQTDSVDFEAFWEMQDDLDVKYIYSNNVHPMLMTYGVEAARETIIKELKFVFNSYGSINIRHLTFVADFMTHAGGYHPMNRMGGIAESTSPFLKMCFETASNFIVEAAYHGQVDNLETPSSRICLGLPVKMGTGDSFDLIHKLKLEA